jgi:phospholipid/cholesterol/gamma-HCH transport system substrate-binding protein
MEKTTSQKIRLGFFVIIGLLLFILAIYFVGSKQKMFGKTNHLEAVFNNVNGLQLGNNVRYSGINVGTVLGIEMDNDSIIRVDMIIDKAIFPFIKKDAIATISSDGLVGNMIVNIIPGKGIQPSVEPGDRIRSQNKVRTEDILNTLSVTNVNASKLSYDLLKITKQINEGKGTIGTLLQDTTMANNLKETINYLKTTGKGTAESVSELKKIIRSLDKKDNVVGVIKDTAVANKIRNMVTNLDLSTKEINGLVTNLNATILNVKDGKGALNYLSNDPKLVTKIDSTMTNMNQASFRLNENLEAMKHNFFFRAYFKKQAKEKAKEQKK